MEPEAAAGQTFIGSIKSYSLKQGYGFVICPKLKGDYFFLYRNLQKEVIHRTQDDRDFKLDGREVAFTVEITEDGKPTCKDMRLIADMGPLNSGHGPPPKGKSKGDNSGKADTRYFASESRDNYRSYGGDRYGGDRYGGDRYGGDRYDDGERYYAGGADRYHSGGGGERYGSYAQYDDEEEEYYARPKGGGNRRDDMRDRYDSRDNMRGMRDRDGKGYNPYDDYYPAAEGKGHTGINSRNSGSSGMGGKGRGGGGGRRNEMADGIPLLEDRAQAKMKSYSNGSKWGFALCDPAVGDFGDIFVHANNLDKSLTNKCIQLRDGDIIEMDLEEVDGKPVAKRVTLVPQEPNAYSGQWMRGHIKEYNTTKGFGFIEAPRVWGDIWFSKTDMAKSMWNKCSNADVMFKLVVGADEKPKAKSVNFCRGMTGWEAEERLREIIDSLHADGFVDETAVKSLRDTDPAEFISVLPELAFYGADNPSSFILGALSRNRKGGPPNSSSVGGGRGGKNDGGRSRPY